MATNTNTQFTQLGALPGYISPVQTSSFSVPTGVSGAAPAYSRNNPHGLIGGASVLGSYASLAAQANQDRQASMQRAADRQNAVIAGYDQQIGNSRQLGDQGYNILAGNYDALSADAAATRDRNMARIDQYGNSMRSDLNIANQQALSKASQSAIQRGLGNTTIQDSMVRGQNFDNTRQRLSLEDQLLQNRISTDASLSDAYQSTLLNKATGLASQWNQNMSNENQLTSNRLGYIGGIQDDKQFSDIANIYSQGLQMENANQQASYDRAAANPQKPYSYIPSYTYSTPW